MNRNFIISLGVPSRNLAEAVYFACSELPSRRGYASIITSYLKEMILICTMNIHFLFNRDLYLLYNGVDMSSLLDPVQAVTISHF